MALGIYPSLINKTVEQAEKIIKLLDPHVPGYHIDIMDGVFVSTTGGSPAFANNLAEKSMRTDFWVHLMVMKPQDMINAFLLEPGSIITFHIESQCDIKDVIKSITEKNWTPSLAISPKTALEKIFPYLNEISQVLVMSVEPGYAGQAFLPEIFEKIQTLRAYKTMHNLPFSIAVDGGVNKSNLAQLAQAGVSEVAIASALLEQKNILKTLEELEQLAE